MEKVEAGHRENLIEATGESAARLQQVTQHSEMPVPGEDHQGQQQRVEWNRPQPSSQTVCAGQGGAGEVTQAFWRIPEDPEWIPDIGH